jgi:glycosyltransferase involved in cell wall biosynthesis
MPENHKAQYFTKVDEMVSVIITNYNYEQYVGRAIESALAQTYADLEIIVVDDGSSDNSDWVIQSYANSDSRVRYIRQANAGQSAATNRGILAAKGEYIAFLDADDIWYPDKLALQMEVFESESVSIVYSGAFVIDGDDRVYNERMVSRAFNGEGFLWNMICANVIPFSSAVVRRECFAKGGLLNTQYRVCTDYDLWLRMGKYYSFDCVEKPLIGYRARPDSLSGNPDEMFRTATEITDIFVRQNRHLFNKSTLRKEKATSWYNRFYTYRKYGDLAKSSRYLMRLLCRFPFRLSTLKAIMIFFLGPRLCQQSSIHSK